MKFHNKQHNNLIFAEYYYDDQMKEDEMCRECSTHGRYEKCSENVSRKT
jgi:hypothetical protein